MRLHVRHAGVCTGAVRQYAATRGAEGDETQGQQAQCEPEGRNPVIGGCPAPWVWVWHLSLPIIFKPSAAFSLPYPFPAYDRQHQANQATPPTKTKNTVRGSRVSAQRLLEFMHRSQCRGEWTFTWGGGAGLIDPLGENRPRLPPPKKLN